MLTLKHLERLWNAADYPRLARDLLAGRAEASPRVLLDCSNRVACAALALIRLDEFAQPFHPLSRPLLLALLSAQHPDGGWGDCAGDAATTALVLRALATSSGRGTAIDRGLAFLADLQRPDGGFARVPIRRAETDPLTTALVAHHLSFLPAGTAEVDLPAARHALNHVPAAVLGPLAPRPNRLRTAPRPTPNRIPTPQPTFAFAHPN